MNKILFWIRNLTFLIVIGIFLFSFSSIQSISYSPEWTTLYGFVTMFLLIEVIIGIVKKYKINEDNRYNILFIITNLFFIFIYFRTMFDTSITTVYLGVKTNYIGGSEIKYSFMNANFIWMILLNLGLFLYPITYIFEKNLEK